MWRANIGQSQSDLLQLSVAAMASGPPSPVESAEVSLSENILTDSEQNSTNLSLFSDSAFIAPTPSAAAIAFESLPTGPRGSSSRKVSAEHPIFGGDNLKALNLLIAEGSSSQNGGDQSYYGLNQYEVNARNEENSAEFPSDTAFASFDGLAPWQRLLEDTICSGSGLNNRGSCAQ